MTDFLAGHALTTISTVLDRLSHKGLVCRRNRGHSVWFSPVQTRAEHTVLLMREVLATTSAPEDALFEFVRQASQDEVKILRRAINDSRR